MPGVEITVRGSHTANLPPEQGTVHIQVATEGPASQPVFDAVAIALAEVKSSLESRHHPKAGPVTRFTIDQVRRGSHRPIDRDGNPQPSVHTAEASVTATFTDFDELAAWVGWTAGLEVVNVGYIDWSLRRATRLRVERKTRQKAVRDAKRRAQDYADALDLGPVLVRRISDPGMGAPAPRRVMMAAAMSVPPGGVPEVSLRPEDVQVDAQVEATFEVTAGKLQR